MKSSELKAMISEIVKEEVKKMLPTILSEMFVRRIVSEQVSNVAPQQQVEFRQGKTLAERLSFEQAPARPALSRDQLRDKIRGHVLADPETNPMAALYEGTQPIDESATGVPEVSLEALGLSSNIARIAGISESNDRAPIQETEAMVQKRIDAQRKKLDAIVVG